MMPFNANMVPVTPFGVQPYVPSMYGSLHAQSGLRRMGGLAPAGTKAEQPLRHLENLELQNSNNRIRYSHESRQRTFDYEGNDIQKRDDDHNLERLSEYKPHRDKGKALSNSEESHGGKLQKHPDQKIKFDHRRYEKRGHCTNDRGDHGSYHTDRSVSSVDDVHSGNYRYDVVRHKKFHESSRRHHNSREQSGSDCSFSRPQIKK